MHEPENGNTNWPTHETMEKFIVGINYSIVLLDFGFERECVQSDCFHNMIVNFRVSEDKQMTFMHWLKGTNESFRVCVCV